MVPDGWHSEKIGKLCKSIVPGRNKPKSFDGDVPWVTTPDLTKKYIPQPSHELHVSKEELSKAGGKTIPSGSVVISCVGELGLTAINTREVVINQQLHAFVCPESLMAEYVYYFIQTRKSELYSLASTTTIPYLNKSNCESITLSFPRLSEQREIVDILSTWDLAIETTEKLIVNSRSQKKALMQQLLTGKKRLPGFHQSWRKCKFGDVANIAKGKALSGKDLRPGDYPVIAGGKVSPYNHDEFTHRNVVTISASGAYAGFVSYHKYPIWASDCSVIEGSSHLEVEFAHQFLRWRQERLYSLQSGGAQPHIYPKDIASLDIFLPSTEEQRRLALLFDAADDEIDKLQELKKRLETEKAALMQQLLTGKRRVKVEESAVA